MHKFFLLAVGLFVSVWFSPVFAKTSAAMVLSVGGGVNFDLPGKEVRAVEAFTRLLDGDRIKLGADGKIVLAYVGTGRQETWHGGGVVQTGRSESSLLSGQPTLATKELPRKVVQLMLRTPVLDASGKVGMVRSRARFTEAQLNELEQTYNDLRSTSTADDRYPEVFLLAGLFHLGAFDRLQREVGRVKQAYSDASAQQLVLLYEKAISDNQSLEE